MNTWTTSGVRRSGFQPDSQAGSLTYARTLTQEASVPCPSMEIISNYPD
jgi:hypothetical protein